MDYLHVKNLEKYHPGYKDRDLKWFKCYFKMVNADPEFEMLCEIDKWRFIAFIILELQYQKPIPIDSTYLSRKGFDLKKRSISLSIQMLHNSVDVVTEDSIPCDESVTQIREEKRRIEKKESRFAPPSVQEVSGYAKEINYQLDGQQFVDFYTQKGWMVGKNKMKDWKAAVRTWKSRHAAETPTDNNTHCQHPGCSKYWTGDKARKYCKEHKPKHI